MNVSLSIFKTKTNLKLEWEKRFMNPWNNMIFFHKSSIRIMYWLPSWLYRTVSVISWSIPNDLHRFFHMIKEILTVKCLYLKMYNNWRLYLFTGKWQYISGWLAGENEPYENRWTMKFTDWTVFWYFSRDCWEAITSRWARSAALVTSGNKKQGSRGPDT
jgi:hypothetical protein